MFIIRKEQISIFSEYMVKSFEDRMVKHLKSNFPFQTKDMTETDIRKLIRQGIDRAAKYEVVLEDDIQLYLVYMLKYSHDFDTNPNTSWAGRILRVKNLSGTEKMNRIQEITPQPVLEEDWE